MSLTLETIGVGARHATRSFMAGLLWCSVAVATAFEAEDVELCAAGFDVVDPEFDALGEQLVYMDSLGAVRVVPVMADGTLGGAGCAGEVVADAAIWTLPGVVFRQGPEWGFSQRGAEVIYTRMLPDGRFSLARAWRNNGVWQADVLARGEDRGIPVVSKDAADAQSRVLYLRRTAAGKHVPHWRESTLPFSETALPVSGNPDSGGAPRWVPGSRRVTTVRADADGVYQAAVYDIDTQATRVLTSGPGNKDEVWLWRAPEFGGDWAMLTVVDFCCLKIHRELDGVFTEVHSIDVRTLTGLNKIYSPEPNVVGGRSYVAFQASNIKLDPKSQIWVVGIDPAAPLARQVSTPGARAIRIEPEWLNTPSGAYVYYTQYDGKLSALRRAATGLLP